MFKRGHSQEVRRGRLPLAKLDYLQTLLVRSAAGAAAAAARAFGGAIGGAVRGGWRAAAEAVAVAGRQQQGVGAAEGQEGGVAVAGSMFPEIAVSEPGAEAEEGEADQEPGSGKEDGVAASRRQTGGGPKDVGAAARAQAPLGAGLRVAEEGERADAADAAAAGDSFAVRTRQAADMLRAALVERGIPPRLAAAGRIPLTPCRYPYQAGHALRSRYDQCYSDPSRAGSSIMAALSEVGLVPRLDVLSLEEAERAFPVTEPPDVMPKYLRKLSLEEVLGEGGVGKVGGLEGGLEVGR